MVFCSVFALSRMIRMSMYLSVSPALKVSLVSLQIKSLPSTADPPLIRYSTLAVLPLGRLRDTAMRAYFTVSSPLDLLSTNST